MISIDTISFLVSNIGIWFLILGRSYSSNYMFRNSNTYLFILMITSAISLWYRISGKPNGIYSKILFYISSTTSSILITNCIDKITSSVIIIYTIRTLAIVTIFGMWFMIPKISNFVDCGSNDD